MSKTALTKPAAYTPANVRTNYDANIDASNANFTELYGLFTTAVDGSFTFYSSLRIVGSSLEGRTVTVTVTDGVVTNVSAETAWASWGILAA